MTDFALQVAEPDLAGCRKLIAAGRTKEALALLEEIHGRLGETAEWLHLNAVALHISGRAADSVAFFEKAIAAAPGQHALHHNFAAALGVLGRTSEAIDHARKAIALDDKSANAHANLVALLGQANRFADADAEAETALQKFPHHVPLIVQAVHAAIELKAFARARELVERGLALSSDEPDLNAAKGLLLQLSGLDADALGAFDAALARRPLHQQAMVNKGISLRNIGQANAAVLQFRNALRHWPDQPIIQHNLSMSMLLAGDWANAWAGFEQRIRAAGALARSPKSNAPFWNGAPAKDKTLLVVHEQGFGDTFQFLRFLPVAIPHVREVVFVCQHRLFAVLSCLELFRSGRVRLISDRHALPPHELQLPLMSFPRLVGLTQQTIPLGIDRISLERKRVDKWAAFPEPSGQGGKWRIGLCWQGNPNVGLDRGRSFALEALAPLADLAERANFISLQRFDGSGQAAPAGMEISIPGPEFDAGDEGFLDTAAMMLPLDLVITADTAIAHLAGLLGRPVWLLLRRVPDWRWGMEGCITSWYPSMRLYRQVESGDWSAPVSELVGDLKRLVGKSAPMPTEENYRVAVEAHMRGEYDLALGTYREVLNNQRSNPQVLNLYAMGALEEGARSAAVAREMLPFAQRSCGLAPANADFWSNFAVLLDCMAAPSDAVRALRFALAVKPGHIPSTVALSKKLSASGNPAAALDMLNKAGLIDAKSAPVQSAVAAVYSDLGNYAEAEQAMRRCVDYEGDNPRSWVQFGAILSAANKPRAAAECWERALLYDPLSADAWSNLGVNERNHGHIGLALYFQRRAVECDPHHAEGWNNLGIAELEADHEDEAIAAFRRAMSERPGYADPELALGMALLNHGNFEEGLPHYEARLRSQKLGIADNRPNLPFWDGRDPQGLRFFLMAEQGFGDAFQFSRYARWLKERGARKVYIGCRNAIGHLLEKVPGVDAVFKDGDKVPDADVLAYLMSMPALTGLRLDTIPSYDSYMSAEPERITRWAEWLAARDGLRVGIAWQGNPDLKVDKGRSFPLSSLEPVAAVKGVRLISLQKGFGEEQIKGLNSLFEVEVPGPGFDEGGMAFADSAALIANLDLVVTSDTAVAHLAGALGKPCWIVLKSNPEWRWLKERSDSPWYPHTRLFRRVQDEVEEKPFSAVMSRIAGALAKLSAGDLAERTKTVILPSVKISRRSMEETYKKASHLQQKGDFQGSDQLYAEALSAKRLSAPALHMLGVNALHRDRDYRAAMFFREAGRRGMQTPEYLTNYSIACRRIGRKAEARALLEKAIAIRPSSEAYLSLGNLCRDQFLFDEAYEAYTRSIELNPKMSKAHRGLGNLMRDLHRPEESLAAFERARALDPDDADLILDHAHAKLFAGDLIGGFIDYEARWNSKEMKPRQFSVPRWYGAPIPDKILLVHGEQGFGDNIQFVRFVTEAAHRAKSVKLEVRKPLVELFRSMEKPANVEVVEQGSAFGQCDLEVAMMTLPRLFGTTLDTLPPQPVFHIDPTRVSAWKERFPSNEFKVGLIWQGNPKARADAGRSPPLSALEPLFSVEGCAFISLQKTDGIEQVRQSAFASGMIVPGEDLGDFAETAAAILALDLVISSCTATLHLAASLGVPVLGVLKYHADWRWLNERADSPWYSSLKLFRQKKVGDWASAIEDVERELRTRVRR